jgi:hypothetical protein
VALALTHGRRTLAAAASLIAAVALALAMAGRGCRMGSDGPDAAVQGMIQAARAGDRSAVFDRLSRATQRALEERARAATDLVGSSVRYTALELVSIGASDDEPAPRRVRVVSEKGDRAVVEVTSAAGTGRIDVVREDGAWRVHLPAYGARD